MIKVINRESKDLPYAITIQKCCDTMIELMTHEEMMVFLVNLMTVLNKEYLSERQVNK